MRKLTWGMIRTDFKNKYPELHKNVIYWRPNDYATIWLQFKDFSEGIYNYDEHKFKWIKNNGGLNI